MAKRKLEKERELYMSKSLPGFPADNNQVTNDNENENENDNNEEAHDENEDSGEENEDSDESEEKGLIN